MAFPDQDSGSTDETATLPRSFMFISVGALAWNLLGVMAYVSQVTMSESALLAMPENEQLLYETLPIWATSAFAIAVNGGAFCCYSRRHGPIPC